ncbi:MAG TPA: DUF3182 family protein [Stellaceae bacterium]|nr:DUF3182 family protein [Stellaceae bacterium]
MARGGVVTYSVGATGRPDGHEASTRKEIARRLAMLMGCAYEGEYDSLRRYATPLYFVPADTLTSDTASRLGIRDERDLYGGVVRHSFEATKAIAHPLLDGASHAPAGWCAEFPRLVAGVVLDGISVFAREDALRAGRQLLELGPVRVKAANGIGGRGQSIANNASDLARVVDAIDEAVIARFGLVIEQNLVDVTTYSVGQVRVADVVCTYHGTQHLTINNRGVEVYGGSELIVQQGDFDTLLASTVPEDIRLAIKQARTFDGAATRCFDGFFASRRNYDVAQGVDAAGHCRSGVLDQSWRLGGASGAEIGALEAFRTDPSLRAVRASSREVYGKAPVLPPNATVYFSGDDPHFEPLTKYAWTELP